MCFASLSAARWLSKVMCHKIFVTITPNMTLLHEVPTAKKSNIRPHRSARKTHRSSALDFADPARMPGLSAANTNVYTTSMPFDGGVAKNAEAGMLKTRAVLKVASNHVGVAAHRFENALDKENVMRAANTNIVRPIANHIGNFDTVKKTKEAVAPAAKYMADAAMMPISAANDNVFVPLVQSEPVQKTKDATIKATEKVFVPIAKKGAHVAMELGKESVNVAVPLAKKGAHSTIKASEKAVAFSIPLAKKGARATIKATETALAVSVPIAKKGAHVAMELGKESAKVAVPAAKKGAQLAMELGTESFETARTMIVQAISYDDHDGSSEASSVVEAPVAKTQMVSYAVASCEMRKMILKQELREKRREREATKKRQGKRSNGSLSTGNYGEKEDTERNIVRKKTKATATTTTRNPPARAAPPVAADATNANNVFVPRVIDSTPAENLYEAPPAPPRMLSYHVREESPRSLVSELTMGTVGRGGSRDAFAPITRTNVVADVPLVVAKRSLDEYDDEDVDRWEC